jgi:DNA-binding transcriptional LysR family regulator
MQMAHEFLATAPFDLRELHCFHALAEAGSFTRAARLVGLTQSSLTRCIQGMEDKLGVSLFERTTRRVTLTEAGEFLRLHSRRVLGDVDAVMQRLRMEFAGARKEVKVGVSRGITLAHLPGLFAANQRLHPEVLTRVYCLDSAALMEALDKRELDLGVVCPPPRLPPSLEVTHRFEDVFALIAHAEMQVPAEKTDLRVLRSWLQKQRWLLLSDVTNTGKLMRKWLVQQRIEIEPAMVLDSFDVITQLVATGMGISLVPRRSLAALVRKQAIQRVPWKQRFKRELVVVARKERKRAAHVQAFVENVLF